MNKTNDAPRIPAGELPTFLRWVATQPNEIMFADDEEMEAIVIELANVLESHPANVLAGLILRSTGLDVLDSTDVASLYGLFCAQRATGASGVDA